MQVADAPSDHTARQLAQACADAMWQNDRASKSLGMSIQRIGPGDAVITMTVRPDMTNGHDICHGGFIFTLADSTFAFACNTYGQRAVAQQCAVTFIRPVAGGEKLTAHAIERSKAGRDGIHGARQQKCRGGGIQGSFAHHRRRDPEPEASHRFVKQQVPSEKIMLQIPLRKLDQLKPQPTELDRYEVAATAELRSLQLERMKWSLRHAYENVPHYKAKFDNAGIHPDHLKKLDDIAKFPFTTKADLRDNYPYGMFAVAQQQIARIHASSGTTGKPTVVGYTKQDIETWSEVVARSIRAAGGRAGMKLHNAYGYGLFTGGLGAHYGAERLGCMVIPVSGGMTERQVQLINDFKPDIIMVTPSYMLAILDEFRKQGLDPRKSSLRIGIFGAEPWTNAMREEIEEAFDIHAVDIYGLSEVMGPGVASECVETKDGLHIWEDHFYPEVIDPHTGKVLPDGEEGELVFTSLTKEALPIIRYRTRDLTRLLPGTARSMRRMEKVTGRTDDMIILRGVNVFPTQIEEKLLNIPQLSMHYQIVLTRAGRMDEMEIHVEARPDCSAPDARKSAANVLEQSIKDTVGVTSRVIIRDPDTIERSAGKAKRIVDRRPQS